MKNKRHAQNDPYAKYSVTLLMAKRIITNISEDRLLGFVSGIMGGNRVGNT